jgi:hypothetical protein
MQEAQANLKQAALEFLGAAQAVTAKAAQSSPDPLDNIPTDVLDLGDLKPAIGPEEFEALKQRLGQEALVPETIIELVALARQVAAMLMKA